MKVVRFRHTKIEIWNDIPGYSGYYQVSNHGRVRSLDNVTMRKDGSRYTRKGQILSPGLVGGYLSVGLWVGSRKQFYIHQLVLLAFIGSCPEGLEVCHYNDTKSDNRLSNLRYGTHVSNCEDRRLHGNDTVGEKQPNHVLTNRLVKKMKREFGSGGVSHSDLSRQYGIARRTISNMLSGRTWKHIQ